MITSEENISQKPAIKLLVDMGYNFIEKDVEIKERGKLFNVLLKDTLKRKLIDLNSYSYKGREYKFSSKNIDLAINDIDASLTNGLIKTNEEIYDLLCIGKSYTETLEDSTFKSFDLKYIDFDNIENNEFSIISEFDVERQDGKGNARPDIVLFINGIPVVTIECKKSSISVDQGIEQTIRNQCNDYLPNLFKFIQIVFAMNKNEVKYATVGTPKKFWNVWKEEDKKFVDDILTLCVNDRMRTNQDENIVSMLHPKRLMELIKYYILFDLDNKKICRYQQFFAVKEIIRTIHIEDKNGNRQSGVIWHTQGSGKSLTMVMLTKYILSEYKIYSPKVILVTDRIDLDKQIHNTFVHTKLKSVRATTGRNLVNLINGNKADIITTVINKFDTASSNTKPILGKDIFVLVDESHRTQYGELNIKMKQVFPNACYLGFTGTPLMNKEKSTLIRFGNKLIHKYTIADGVKDKAILPLLYEGKMVGQTVNKKAIDNQLEIISRNLNDKQKTDLMNKWSNFEKVASSDQRIKLITFDINEHFRKNYKTEGAHFKAMLATNSKNEAMKYFESFEELGDLKTAVVMSPPDMREGTEEVDEQPNSSVIKFYNKIINKYGSNELYEENIKNEFVYGDELDMLIVVDKLLTGFDAPRATVMYIDKPLKEHSLLQAIARVNRLYEGKDYGIIIDYRGLLEKLDSAMKVYSGSGLENFDPNDLDGAVYDIITIINSIRQYYSELCDIFRNLKSKNDEEEYEVFLSDEQIRKEFYKVLSKFSRNMSIAFESERIYNSIDKDELNKYKLDLKFYQELSSSVKIRYSDVIDFKEYEDRMQKLMDNYISAEEIIRITNPVDILNETEFEKELERLESSRAKADTIRTRLSKSISEKFDENPSHYKKFSERIEKILEEYKNKRITEGEYLSKMNEVMNDFRKGSSTYEYPETIQNDSDAQAFYGTLRESIEEINDNKITANVLAVMAKDIEDIISRHAKVDWHDNINVHNKIEQDIEDMLYKYIDKNSITLSYGQIDRLIDNVKTIALRRYKY